MENNIEVNQRMGRSRALPNVNLEMASNFWKESRLDYRKQHLDESIDVIKIGDATIGTLGNFSTIIGKAKSRKTFNVSAVIAAAIKGEKVLQYDVMLPIDKRNVLYVDTEQHANHVIKVVNRIQKMADIPLDDMYNFLEVHCLRSYAPNYRVNMLDYAMISAKNIGLVIVDGLRDLTYDINSSEESTTITSKLMAWTEKNNLHLMTVIHQNKGDDNARGHLGTELVNKSESVVLVEKDKNNPEISKVIPVYIRDKDFKPFAFKINEDGIPVLADGYDFQNKEKTIKKSDAYSDISPDVHNEALEKVFSEKKEIGYEELYNKLMETYPSLGEQLSHRKVVNLIISLRNNGIITKDKSRKYSLANKVPLIPKDQ